MKQPGAIFREFPRQSACRPIRREFTRLVSQRIIEACGREETVTLRSLPGANIALKKLKGRPETFDVEAALRFVNQLRSLSGELFLPGYSRRVHEPIEAQTKVGQEDLIAVIAGNLLLAPQDASAASLALIRWPCLSDLLHVKIFPDIGRDEYRERMLRRQMGKYHDR